MAVPPPPLPFFSLLCPWTLSIHSSCALSWFCPLSSRSSSLSAPAGRSRCAQSDGMAVIGCPPLPPIRSQQIAACSEKADGRSGRGSELILLVRLSAASHWATLVVLAYWLKVHTHTKKENHQLVLEWLPDEVMRHNADRAHDNNDLLCFKASAVTDRPPPLPSFCFLIATPAIVSPRGQKEEIIRTVANWPRIAPGSGGPSLPSQRVTLDVILY